MANQLTKHLIVIAGPTAVGKTAFAIKVAQHYDTEIISCDSRQLYKELKIGVARPSREELAAVPHHFIATHSIHHNYDAGSYARDVDAKLKDLFTRHDTVIMAVGTGLNIKAATDGLDAVPTQNEQLRLQLNFILNSEGIEALQAIAEGAGVPRDKVDYANPQRLSRAIEILQGEVEKSGKEPVDKGYRVSYYYIDKDRNQLYERINKRVDAMIKEGFEEEARKMHANKDLNALNTVGYKEFFNYFDGEWTLEHTIDKMKQHTRNYAKRQLTWFRNQGDYTQITSRVDEFITLLEKD
ncbi:MAG: tRNA (adenosine(37)-N6)-dimethylallyltransferase MiaA [Bacteroidia bacterium]